MQCRWTQRLWLSSKVITDKQKDSIIKYFCDDFDKMKNRKPGRGHDKDDPVRGERHDPLSLLVKDGVISQEQADKIKETLFQLPAPFDQRTKPEHPQP